MGDPHGAGRDSQFYGYGCEGPVGRDGGRGGGEEEIGGGE